jgi:hypothetical protein
LIKEKSAINVTEFATRWHLSNKQVHAQAAWLDFGPAVTPQAVIA